MKNRKVQKNQTTNGLIDIIKKNLTEMTLMNEGYAFKRP